MSNLLLKNLKKLESKDIFIQKHIKVDDEFKKIDTNKTNTINK